MAANDIEVIGVEFAICRWPMAKRLSLDCVNKFPGYTGFKIFLPMLPKMYLFGSMWSC